MNRLLAVLLVVASTAKADPNGYWEYIVVNSEVTITGFAVTNYPTTPRSFVIPSEVGGLPVRKVGNGYPPIFGRSSSYVTNVIIPSSVTSIGDYAFSNIGRLTNIIIPNSVTNIGNYAFDGSEWITDLQIPNSVTSIGDSAFMSCISLTNINIPNGIHSISDNAFAYCTGLKNISIPSGVTNIGSASFQFCTNLTSIIIPDSVTTIGSNAFTDCRGITNILIPFGVTDIAYGTFNGCLSLSNIQLPQGIASIGAWAFANCASLTEVVIPDSVSSIGTIAFYNCTNLARVYFLGNGPTGSVNPDRFDSNATIYFRPNASGWNSYDFGGRPNAFILPRIKSYTSVQTNGLARQVLRFSTFPGLNYVVQKSVDLSGWANQKNITGDGNEVYFSEDSTNSRAFFRVLQQ